jgi:hypothetical protein
MNGGFPGSQMPGAPQSPAISPQQGMPMQQGLLCLQGFSLCPADAEPQPQPLPPSLDKFLEQTNIAENLDEEELQENWGEVYDGYKRDLQSKETWDKQVDEWVKLAAQVKDEKSYPWPKASNVKYPLLATAAMQFAARAYPSLVPADGKIVQFKVVGVDPQGQKAALADKLAKHMNYQLWKIWKIGKRKWIAS